MPYRLSPSSLSLFNDCPRCFWLAQHGEWKRPAGIFPSLPSGMDRILKAHFDRFRAKGRMPPELKHGECGECKLFDDLELLKEWRNNFRGVRWADKEGNALHGAVDELLVKGKKLTVVDFKTRGFPTKDDTAAMYQHQMDIYNLLLRKNGYETENHAYLLFYVPKEVTETGEVVFDTELVKMKVDVDSAERLFRLALKVLEGDCPKETCEWCEKV